MRCVACSREIPEKSKWKLCYECWKVAGEPKTLDDLLKNVNFVNAVLRKHGVPNDSY